MLEQICNFIATDIRMATPLLIAAMGLLFSERAGIVNIGAEGMMLVGAFAGVLGSLYSGSAWVGLLAAAVCGAALSLLFAFFTISLRSNQTVVGVGLNILGLGVTTTLNRVLFTLNAAPPKIHTFQSLPFPDAVASIPVVGPALKIIFSQTAIVYIMILFVIAAQFVLYKTKLGLDIRAVGEHSLACETVGINVTGVKYGTVVFSGAMCGMAGAYLSLSLVSFFMENMVAGRGYMALAAVIFGRYKPWGIMAAVLVFGAGSALEFRMQAAGTSIPHQFLLMLPYILTILALVGVVGRGKGKPPAESGTTYTKD